MSEVALDSEKTSQAGESEDCSTHPGSSSPITCVDTTITNPNGSKIANDENVSDSETVQPQKSSDGGRLQFFLDGKMVLELTDRREAGKSWWVPVTQKTYWPPPASTSCSTPGSTTARQESSASYSVSDDSSVQSQSSPWQRESRWKNPNPRRLGGSNECLTFHVRRRERCRCRRYLRRRPFRLPTADLCNDQCTNSNDSGGKAKGQTSGKRLGVSTIASKLMDKALTKKLLASTTEASLSSPRKRLLRDMEKVRLHDASPGFSNRSSWNALKKAKAVVPPTPLPTHHSAVVALAAAAAAASASAHSLSQPTKVYDRQSSYSIDSLLNSKQERAEASNSSFLRSLLRKGPATSPPVPVNGLSHPSTGSSATTTTKSATPAALYSQSQPLPVSPPELMPMSALQAVLGSRAPLWLPYNVGSLSPFVPPPVPVPMASPLTTPPGIRPGPSSSRSPGTAHLSSPYQRHSSPPSSPSDDIDEAPLNLSTTRSRAES